MLYLETLAERYIEQDGLPVEEQAKIVQDAANCEEFIPISRRDHFQNAD